MARKLIVEVLLDAQQFVTGLKRSSRETVAFERKLTQTQRRVDIAATSFRSLGRGLAFATGGYVALSGVTDLIRASVDAAREAAVAQKSLAAQMKAAGESFAANQARIEAVARSYAKFGFENDEVIKSLTVLERGTGNINRALRLQQLTADIARGKNMDLAAAAGVVAKVFGGQETALRRAVPGLSKHAHGMDLIRLAEQKMAGQAAANTTESERFAATLRDTEEVIGAQLLPTLDKYLKKMDDWLSKTENQRKIQKAANASVRAGAGAFDLLAQAIQEANDALDLYRGIVSHLPGGKKGPLQIFAGGNLLDQFREPLRLIQRLRRDFGLDKPPPAGGTQGAGIFAAGAALNRLIFGDPFKPPPAAKGAAARAGISLAGRFNLAELKLAQAQMTATLSDDRRILIVEKAILEQQVASTKNLKKKTELTKQLAGVLDQIKSIDQASAQALKEQAQSAKDRADAIKSAVLDRLDRQQAARENKRALQDAQQQLRAARQLGFAGPITAATRNLQDVRFNILRARLEAAPARLGGGQFALGNIITVNVHGVTDPDKVAQAVIAAIKRRNRHTPVQTRGPGG